MSLFSAIYLFQLVTCSLLLSLHAFLRLSRFFLSILPDLRCSSTFGSKSVCLFSFQVFNTLFGVYQTCLYTVRLGDLERFSRFFGVPDPAQRGEWKLLTYLLHYTPLILGKTYIMVLFLRSHTLLDSFSSPIGKFRHRVTWNDRGHLELVVEMVRSYYFHPIPNA